MPHFRIERADNSGSKRTTQYDRVFAVGDDGTEVDISAAVRGWNLNSRVASVEEGTLFILGLRVVENPALLPKIEQATAAPGELRGLA